MASAEFDDASAEKRPAVQVGDPFMEKLLLEACLEVMKTGALVGLQDMGAAGLSCATSEMSARGHMGMDVEVTKVPQRETGMTPYEIMLSESQERMLFVVHSGREGDVERIFEKWDLHAVCIGRVTDDGLVRVREHGTVVAEVPTRALTDEAPLYDRPTQRPIWLDDIQKLEPSHFKAFPSTADAPDDTARLPDDRQQGVDLSAVRPHGAHQHPVPRGSWHTRGAREGHRACAGDVGRWQRALRADSTRIVARCSRWPKRRATWPSPAACRSARPTT